MKKIALIILAFWWLFALPSIFAQTPQSFNYQAIIRDNDGKVIANQAVSIRITLIQNETDVYIETHSPTTNGFGLVNLAVGTGTPTLNTMGDVDWSAGACSIKFELDLAGGTDYMISATSELISVPFAKYAQEAKSAEQFTGENIEANTVTVTDVFNLTPRSSQPSNPTEGQMYINSNDHKVYCFLNGKWNCFLTEESGSGGGSGTYTDTRDDNTYSYATIGTQTWMIDNLAYLPSVNLRADGSETIRKHYVFGYDGADVSEALATDNYTNYGVLYNWESAQVACPDGWHIPSDAEWTTLTDYLIDNGYGYEGSGPDIGKSMASASGWTTSSVSGQVGNDQASNNSSGYNAFPGGYRYTDGSFFGLNDQAGFWSSSPDDASSAWFRAIYSSGSGVGRGSGNRSDGYSVRCLQDGGQSGSVPTVTTAEITNISESGASGGGEVTDDGGAEVTSRGVCWSSTENPTISDSKTMDGTGTGSFTSSITGLDPNTTYFVKAYATNSVGTAYGEQKQFTTEDDTGGSGSFTDSRDGNSYDYVTIGTQTWMAENLAFLPSVTGSDVGSNIDPYYYVYGYEGTDLPEAKTQENYLTYGTLYNYDAAKIACPDGWHLPSDEEWSTLVTYIGDEAGHKMKSSSGWFAEINGDNSTGFNALPHGYRPNGGGFTDIEKGAYFWSSTNVGSEVAYRHYMIYNYKVVFKNYIQRERGHSVRCIKDEGQSGTEPTVSTSELSIISATSAEGGGVVSDDGGTAVIARGVCWSTAENPVTTDSKTLDGTGTGSFTSSITDLNPNTTYYIRAYATNSVGTSYGEQRQFSTEDEAGGSGYFADSRDSHYYNYVEIGTQTWMAENLAYLPSVSTSNLFSSVNPFYYVYGYEGTDVAEAKATTNFTDYGVLYNWESAQADCPDGWHLPTDEEWKVLEKFLGMSPTEVDNEGWRESGDVGLRLKSTSGWSFSKNGDNASGFNAQPAGTKKNGFSQLGEYTYFWTQSRKNTMYAWLRTLGVDNGVSRDDYRDYYGFSVRCIRNSNQNEDFPEVKTLAPQYITGTFALFRGEVVEDGGAEITHRGFCWSTVQNPTVNDSYRYCGVDFTAGIFGLLPNTTYYVKTFAMNSVGTAYGSQIQFTTKSEGYGTGFVIDKRDFKTYGYVTIGSQTWMSGNMAYLPSVSPSDQGSQTQPYFYVYNYQGTNVAEAKATDNYGKYGVLYNWEATQEACPNGWHLPSIEEWNVLTNLVWSNFELKSESGWYQGRNGSNSSGFNILPAGIRSTQGIFADLTRYADFFSSSPADGIEIFGKYTSYYETHSMKASPSWDKGNGFSVRCIKNN